MSRRLSGSILAVLAIVGAVTGGLNAYSIYTSARWPNASATFYVNTSSVTDVAPSAAVAAIQAAMDVWNTQSGSAIRFSYGGTTSANQLANDGVNAVFFRQATNGSAIASNYTWWDGSNRIVDSDVVFWDADRTFFTGSSGCTSGAYIEDVAAHEFGHAMALDHSAYADATMYPSYGSCNQGFRTLSSDDIQGARALYPSSQTSNTAPSVSISSPTNGGTYAEGVSVSFVGSASDNQDGSLTAALQWTDNGNAIGSGGSFSRVLTAGTHTITAYVTDSGSLQGAKTVSVTVTSSTPPSSGGTSEYLTVKGRKVKGLQKADLSWTGLSATAIDVYRNGARVMTATPNDGFETDPINRKGSGSYTYKVCAAGTSTCSNSAVVIF